MGLVKERAVARAQRLTTGIETWVDREVAGCEFKDERLGRRFCKLLAQIGSDMGQSIPLVCQDWANTKAAYRFFSNERVDEADTISIGTAFCNTVRTSLYFLGQVHASLRQMVLALRREGAKASIENFAVFVEKTSAADLKDLLVAIKEQGLPETDELAREARQLQSDRFDRYLIPYHQRLAFSRRFLVREGFAELIDDLLAADAVTVG
ncbi:IS4/Tn5 family transposase DNA-binding protein [Bradyrhizobium ottawaense]|uniref:IS4/Tn5 family transposase DNA-binding protein n=1 Tax=Bradyrhizobium ottawaense TaxID=931866 RepID=UPI00383316D2